MMSLLEGHGDVTMDRAGAGPDTERSALRPGLRSSAASAGWPKMFAMLIGLDAKLQQYEQGERFIEAVERQGGRNCSPKVWEGPEWLPSFTEIRNPDLWIRAGSTGPGGPARRRAPGSLRERVRDPMDQPLQSRFPRAVTTRERVVRRRPAGLGTHRTPTHGFWRAFSAVATSRILSTGEDAGSLRGTRFARPSRAAGGGPLGNRHSRRPCPEKRVRGRVKGRGERRRAFRVRLPAGPGGRYPRSRPRGSRPGGPATRHSRPGSLPAIPWTTRRRPWCSTSGEERARTASRE